VYNPAIFWVPALLQTNTIFEYLLPSNTTTFSWVSSPAGFTSSQKDISVAPTVTTTYYLTVSNSTANCIAKDTVLITVNNCPIVTNNNDTTSITSICNNSDFETGQQLAWNDWHAGYGKISGNSSSLDILDGSYSFSWGIKNNESTTTEIENQTAACTNYFSCNAAVGIPAGDYEQVNQNHHRVVGAGTDPIVPFINKTHAGSSYSLKLGNSGSNNGFEFVEKKFFVTAANTNFSFWYAYIMSNPEHGAGENQYFGVDVFKVVGTTLNKITNAPTGGVSVNVGSGNYYAGSSDVFSDAYARNKFCSPTQSMMGGIKYKNWSYVPIDLSNQIGNTIVIRIWTRDCSHCGDFAYAYLDDFCSVSNNTNPTGNISIANADTCGLVGKVCVDFKLPFNGIKTGTLVLTMPIYINGSTTPIFTLTSPVLDSTFVGPYCFPINSIQNLPFGTTSFDYAIKGVFKLNTTTVLTQTIGTSGIGIKVGSNNDYKINCQVPCNIIANAGLDKIICPSVLTPIGSPAVSGNTYSWSSNPVGFTSTVSNPSVNPSVPTTYYLIVTNTATQCVAKDTVVITINSNCTPPVCTTCQTVVSGTNKISLISNSTTGVSLLSQSFSFTGLPTNITEVKATLTNLKLWATDETGAINDQCLTCITNPMVWGSIINGGGIAGIVPKINISGAETNAPVSISKNQNPRQIVWKNGSNFSVNNPIQLSFYLPSASTLKCCTRKATICIKFVFRNDKCEECIAIKCFDIEIK
jgi:hypothetical protein